MASFTAMTFAVMCCSVALIYQRKVYGLWTTFMLVDVMIVGVGYSLALAVASLQHRQSKLTLESWKRNKWVKRTDREYMQRLRWSCTAISFGNGHSYVITPIMVLSFIHTVSQQSFFALVTYADVFRTKI
ncbi:unnamed protein product [Orchesella dallaii]|uniref:Uncharacterized protein n=1 Tax=Orchesella dallaii TaxID=48710 RepID=A0ABP1RIM0_9HEXA